MALALLFGGILLVGLAADVTRLVAAWQETSHVAHTAAEVSAGWVQPTDLYRGRLVIDRRGARTAGRAYLASVGHQGSIDAQRTRVCVTVRSQVSPGITRLVGAGVQTVAVTACAEPRQG